MKAIASRDNPRFKRLRRWATQPRARRSDNVLLLDGLHLIVACLDAGGRLAGLLDLQDLVDRGFEIG